MKLIKYWYCYIGIFFILVDRVTKLWAEHRLIESHYVTSFLSYELVHNTGVSFSLFSDYVWFLVPDCCNWNLISIFYTIND